MDGRRQPWRALVALVSLAVLWSATVGLGVRAQGTDDLAALRDQVSLLLSQGKSSEAVPIAERYASLARERYGEDHLEYGAAIAWLAFVYRARARYADVEPLYKRSLVIMEKALGPDHPNVGISLNNLAELYHSQGRYAEAEPLYQRDLAIQQKALGPDHPAVGRSLNNLALLYRDQGRYGEAEPQYQRSLAIWQKALGPDHPDVATSLNNLADLYQAQGRNAEAEPFYQRSLAIREKALGPEHPDVGTSLSNLAELLSAQGRYGEAEPLYQRSLAIQPKALGPDHPNVGFLLNNLALLYRAQDRYVEAEPLFQRSLAIMEKALGPDHPNVGTSLNNLALLHFVQRDWLQAADYWRRGTALLVRRAERGTADVGRALTGRRKGEAEQQRYQFLGLAKATNRLAGQDHAAQASLAREMFQTAQWALSSDAASSLAQMAARGARGDATLAAVVRERQDMVEEWQKRDAVRTAAVSQSPDKRDSAAEAANTARLAAIDTRIIAIDNRLIVEFPDYTALARPSPLAVQEVQAQLGSDEALVLFLGTTEWTPTPEETFIWVVTKTDMRWVRSDMGTPALQREVAALRCGLDAGSWDDDAASARCRDLLKVGPERDVHDNVRTETLPFARSRAHDLYKALFGQIEDLIRDKHLLIVPSGPLTQLPFQALVTAASTDRNHRAAAWLARKHAITVLPAVSSLKALRRVARLSAATKPMIGVGNPLLDGGPGDAKWAALARQKQVCPGLGVQQVANARIGRGAARIAVRGGHPDLVALRKLSPLDDTADELCAVAKDLALSSDDILLGAKATEASIKKLSSENKLSAYRVVHFATHGTVAGEIEGTSEPGLILTPPQEQSDLDDGYLSASEVAALKLDADWVILSACNTAAGGAQGAEALSGLARAFIYAGARAMLVSHWAVDSAATAKLISAAVGATSRDKRLGRAEALRRAMLAMIDKGEPHEAHPAYWAPFIVVGEGAAR